MPTYLLHGFRWPRPLIRIHVVMQNLDDAAPEWVVAPGTTLALLRNFQQLYPECMQHLNRLRFVEQFDPRDTDSGVSQPFAYVADVVEEVRLGVEIDEVRGRGLSNDQWGAVLELRDKLAPEEKVGWYVVVCGDEERMYPASVEPRTYSATNSSVTPNRLSGATSGVSNVRATRSLKQESTPQEEPEPRGLKKLLSNSLRRRKSHTTIRGSSVRSRSRSSYSTRRGPGDTSSETLPPLPTSAVSNDGSSSMQSVPPSAAASTPPPSGDLAELPAITPSSTNSTPDNFIPEINNKAKQARVSRTRDYRGTRSSAAGPEPAQKPSRVAVYADCRPPVPPEAVSINPPQLKPAIVHRTSDYSIISTVLRGSRHPESGPDYYTTSSPNETNRAGSPLAPGSIKPADRSTAVDPVLIGEQHSEKSLNARMPEQERNLNHMAQVSEPQTSNPDSDDEIEEVVVMSPAIREPIQRFLQRSGTPSTLTLSNNNMAGPDSTADSSYFGQNVSYDDLVAVNLEHAFERL